MIISLILTLGIESSPVNDPIMTFVASEDDEEEEKLGEKGKESEESDGKMIELIPNQDILIHKPHLSPRPIIRTTLSSSALLSSPRSESGSQTDITALRDDTRHRSQNGPIQSKVN